MPKFTKAVQVENRSGEYVGFLPGDDVPAWAFAKVGTHARDGGEISAAQVEGLSDAEATSEAGAIIARAENDAAGIVAKAEAEAASIIAEAQANALADNADKGVTEEAEDDSQSEANAEAEESAEPDFTKAAAPKRGRPRKQV